MPIQEQDQAATSSTSTEKETDMTRFRQTLTGAAVATALLASLSLPSFAQTAPAEQPAAAQKAPEPHKHQRGDKRGDRMEHMKQRMEKLKADLKLTPAQQTAWTTYTQAMKPGERPAPGDREAFAKLTTPERIDKMREMRGKRMAEMDRRAEATKAFYAQLNAEQKKTFDAATLHMHHQRGEHHHGHHGGKPGQERPAAPAPAAK
jgi:hypothetical protein